jgi:hypothetical protein
LAIADLEVDRPEAQGGRRPPVRVSLEVHGTKPVAPLAATISGVPGMHEVRAGDANELLN